MNNKSIIQFLNKIMKKVTKYVCDSYILYNKETVKSITNELIIVIL